MKNFKIFNFLLLFLIFFQFTDQQLFPDYDSYQRIYLSFGLDFDRDWEPFFTLLNFVFNFSGFEYDNFRLIILIISLSSIFLTFNNLQKVIVQKKFFNWFLQFLIIAILSIIFFEFLIVRIRAGLSSAFFLLGFSYLLLSKNKKINKAFAFVIMIISSQTHFNTFLILSFFLLIPYFVNKFTFNHFFVLIYFIISTVVSFFLIMELDISVEDRGSNTYSDLNIFRFVFISVVPVFIFFLYNLIDLYKKSLVLYFEKQLIPIRLMTINYISLSIALIFLYPLGYTDYSGEAIVRIFSLSSITFVFLINIYGIDYWWLWLYLGLINSIFFINTVFLQ